MRPLALVILGCLATWAAEIETGNLPLTWRTGGPDCTKLPAWQIHEYNAGMTILRESGCINYEKPFLYLIKGSESALLIDTGAGKPEIAPEIAKLWTKKLIVVHSHKHGDHVAGDKELAALPNVEMVSDPAARGKFELGGRTVEAFAIPGHHASSVAYYDARTAILFSGDSLYPGRLYIDDFPAFRESTRRMADFTKDKPVAHILGAHIEQSRTPFVDYPIRTLYQPEEHSLELGRAHLLELQTELERMGDTPQRLALRSFTIFPRPPRNFAEPRKKSGQAQQK